MVSSPYSSIADARKELGARLRQVRQGAGLTGRALAALCGMHSTRLSRLEHGNQVPTERNIRDWCHHCGVPELAPELLATLHALDTAYVEWKARFRGGLKGSGGPTTRTLYARTAVFRIHEPLIIPGILQTTDYMRSLLAYLYELHRIPHDLDETIRFRQERAALALNGDKRVLVVLFEEALRFRYSPPDVHAAQLVHLLSLAELPFLSLGVVPTDSAHRGVSACGFWIFDAHTVQLAIPSAEIKVTRPQEIDLYERWFAELQSRAAYGRDAARLIAAALRAP
ncbi:transcriptional regulator [Pilimelia anulata]|uniref:Transcriptional regulator n=1 Tax=Pilimelia anulata TaxID=53371 RepID=A0A8J3AZK0_9ACTN|nr:helix-turn-helix transcriptional regulator [Pilimelia anulata]GGJ74847.1 transcriptional regulator [Pilimelia anulata]